MKCGRCRAPAVIEVRRHNAGYCQECFVRHCGEQVRRAIDHFAMFGPDDRILVAVSGGKELIQQAAKECPLTFAENSAARTELKRLP